MEDAQSYAALLEERLNAKRDRLDRIDLPALRDAFKVYQSAYRVLIQVLLKKGVLHEDPYKYDLKISEVTTPPEGPYAESEKVDQMSLRASQFDSYLDFLNNYYQFSSEFLTMGRVKRLLGLAKYFNFSQFSDTSSHLNTKALAELVGMVKKGGDQLSAGIIADSVGQLDKANREILAILKDLTGYHKERYKLELRQIVMPGIGLEANFVITHRDDAVKSVKRKFAEVAAERPFYPELVEEALAEDFTSDGPGLRERVLAGLAVEEERKAERGKERSYKAVILDGARVLAGAAYPLEDALAKLGENSAVLQLGRDGFMARMGRMIRKIFNPGDKGVRYDIEILDPLTGQRAPEVLDFPRFVEDAGKKARVLASLMQRGGAALRRVEGMSEEQSYKFLVRNIEELQRTLRVLAGLDEFFKDAARPEDKGKMRSVKVEITTIKGAVIKANQKKHEYVAQREEVEQLRRLGVRDAG